MRRLDRRDHFEPREPADVVERDDLRVLDPRAQRVTLLFRQQGLERVEHEAIAGVTDRVHVQLPALGRGQRREFLHLLARVHHQPAMVRLIAVVLHERGAATAECAVGPGFHGAHLQTIVVFGHARTGLHQAATFGAVVQHRVDADRQASGGAQLAIQTVDALADTGIVHACHAERGNLAHCGEQLSLHFRIGGLRNVLRDQLFRRIDQYAGRLAGSVAHDLAALRVRRSTR